MELFDYQTDFNMNEGRNDNYTWESTVRLSLIGREEEDIGMFLEERDTRKRKWQEGKTERKDDVAEKEQRKMPPKKIMAVEAVGSGASSSSSHLSPGWQVNDLDLDLPGELSMNEALMSLPSLATFKQEAPSPTGRVLSPPRRRLDPRQAMVVDTACREPMDEGCQPSPPQSVTMMSHHSGSSQNMQYSAAMPPVSLMPISGYSPTHENKNPGLLMCSNMNTLDSYLHSPMQTKTEMIFKDDTRFQYVLAAATSIATKQNEETLTYLNQGQPYEVKLKKLGDLSHFKGRILKSVIKICFHERRLQYMEREQIAQWHADRPGERILEIDVPLSYGIIKVQMPTMLNALHVYWDPTKDVGVYIKVNCISTEFTAKKHGGEKGVPFRIQIETYMTDDDVTRLHAAACQIKVFKLKGADRKHKQDREKVMRRPRCDLEKYQPGCEATVLTTLSNDAMMPPPSLVTSSPPYSPDLCTPPKVASPIAGNKPALAQSTSLATTTQLKPLYCQDGNEMKVSSPPCPSPGAILPDLPQAAEDPEKNDGLSKDATETETQAWLTRHRFEQHAATFTNFSGSDLLRLSRDDIIQICGLADGIRLFNTLHAKRIQPRLTVYVCASESVYCALYLHACRATELLHHLQRLHPAVQDCETVLVSGPNGARVRLTDELVRHMADNSTYRLERAEDTNALLLCATHNNR